MADGDSNKTQSTPPVTKLLEKDDTSLPSTTTTATATTTSLDTHTSVNPNSNMGTNDSSSTQQNTTVRTESAVTTPPSSSIGESTSVQAPTVQETPDSTSFSDTTPVNSRSGPADGENRTEEPIMDDQEAAKSDSTNDQQSTTRAANEHTTTSDRMDIDAQLETTEATTTIQSDNNTHDEHKPEMTIASSSSQQDQSPKAESSLKEQLPNTASDEKVNHPESILTSSNDNHDQSTNGTSAAVLSPGKSTTEQSPHEQQQVDGDHQEMDIDMPNAPSDSKEQPPTEEPSTSAIESPSASSTKVDDMDNRPSTNTMESTSATTEANVTETTTTGKTTTAVSSANDERQNNTTQSSATASSTAAPTSNVSSSSNTQNGYRPLNVKDALTYLDQVKVQFSEHPEVYNKFLDIMKDFKSQAIDTPGVIERVSTLFRGHPLLISGFNTFLPPGYCIECITDEHSHDIIKVTTPNGTTTTNAGEPLRLGSETTGAPTHEQLYYGTTAGGYSGYGTIPPGSSTTTTTMYGDGGHGTGSMTIHHLQQHPGQQHLPPPIPGQQHHLQQLHHPNQSLHQQQQQPHPHMVPQQLHHPVDDGLGNRRAPVEFNHAINYVNKIKNRFSSDPDIYKQFLEILQTYQKEQRPIQEVYGQVQVLFNGDSDLLAEFKQFLPDTTGGASTAVYTSTPHSRKGLVMVPGLSSGPQGRKKRATNMLTSGISKRSKLQNKMDTQTSDVRSGMSLDQDMVRPFVSGEEVEFFEQVKKYIGSKATYNAFLKVLNLFSQQIVDQNVLVNRVEGFIGGNKELFDMFKTLVGYDGKDEIVENVPADLDKPDLSTCRACGPSYRLIPKSWEQSQVCSGKDELCLEVLNDKYVSHPTWASEDSGYVTSKKNQYEEALHRVEEERYDYDLNIEANLNTIALLEPIMKKISAMTPEEKAEFTLPVGLGGPSKTIYQRIIKKIYGNDKGLQVIGLLHSSPAQTVPIVLKRLKQKDDEWKRAQREWNKIWREVEAKNYLKALDYQGITFKSSDKRSITTKHLITEIEERRMQQQEEYHQHRQEREISSSTTTTTTLLAPARKPPQFTFVFDQKSVLKDVMRLIYYFLDRTELYSAENQDKMRSFMETLLPLIFDVDSITPDGQDVSVVDDSNGTGDDEVMGDGVGGEEDGDEEAAADDDEAADEADDEEDEESRSIQSYDSDGDAIMATRRNGSSTTTATRSIKKNNGSNSKRSTLKDILTRNISSTHTSGVSTPSNTTTTGGTSTSLDATVPSDSESDSIPQQQQQQQQEQPETDVDVPEANNNDVKTDESQETTKEEIPTNNEKEDQQRALPKEQTPTTTTTTTTTGDTSHKRHVYNLFADSEFYCFFRLYQLIYERLCQMKSLDEEYKKDPIKTKRENKAALNLGLKSKAISDFHLKFNKGYYQALLTLIEKFFEGDIDQSLFEESSRYIFGSKAYVLFTIDKVMLALIRHTHLIISNDKSPLLLDLFKQDHSLEHVDAQILGDYRLRVEDIVGKEEVLFNIAFDTIRRTLSIQILSGDDEDYEKNSRDDYEEYVSNYIDWANATKGINTSDLTPRFLKRNMNHRSDEADDVRQDIFVRSGMQYKICRDTYHMFYIIGTEDIFIRLPTKPRPTQQQQQQESSAKWTSWLESNWSKGISDKEQAEKDARQLLFSN